MHYLYVSPLPSPLGDMRLVTDVHHAIRALDFADHESHLRRGLREQYGDYELEDAPAPPVIVNALVRYFDGDLQALDVLPVATQGSQLQEQVWRALRHIPAGTTTSYGKLAKALGFEYPRAAIGIGAANGANQVAIIVPCHRVVASDGCSNTKTQSPSRSLHRRAGLCQDSDINDLAYTNRSHCSGPFA